jgi:hypothetical protein
VTRCSRMMISDEGDATLRKGKGGDDISWIDVNFIGSKNKENTCD